MNMNAVNISLFCQIAYYMFNIAYEICRNIITILWSHKMPLIQPIPSTQKMAVTGKVPLWALRKGSEKIDIFQELVLNSRPHPPLLFRTPKAGEVVFNLLLSCLEHNIFLTLTHPILGKCPKNFNSINLWASKHQEITRYDLLTLCDLCFRTLLDVCSTNN